MSDHLLQRARLLRDHHRYDEAIAAIHQYLAADPDSFSAHYELAVARMLEGSNKTKALEDTEYGLRVGRFGVAELEALIARGEVCDAASVAAWHRVTRR